MARPKDSDRDSTGRDPFDPTLEPDSLSADALATAERLRGKEFPPLVMLLGVRPRSGTNWVGDILRQHPDVFDYPNSLWEFPLLRGTGGLLAARDEFFAAYPKNAQRMGRNDLLPLIGSAVVAHLLSYAEPGRTVLVKDPSVRYLDFFPALFPFERCLLLLRDGRDVAESTLRSFGDRISFEQVCRRWARAARAMLDYAARQDPERTWLVRYEEVFAAPDEFAREACRRFGLDPERFPYDALPSLPLRGSSEFATGNWEYPPSRERPAGFQPIGRWHDWSAEQHETFERLAGDALRAAGYGDSPKAPSARRRASSSQS